jgi:transcriptional regulator with XRE-family HTH domain
MNTNDVERRISENLRTRREALGLSLAQLAGRSGVSKAMIAKVEAGQSSPTAGLLGRLCSGLGVTLSSLMASAETAEMAVFPVGAQVKWRDPETTLERTVVAPVSPPHSVEIARLKLPAGVAVGYPVVPSRFLRQHIVMLSGTLTFSIGGESHTMAAGDCLFAVIDRPTRLEAGNAGPAEYLVIQDQS